MATNHILDDEEKEVLLERCLDLEFVDDVTELSCKRCKRVLIHHYVANCGHLFCRNCKRVLSQGKGWTCPECREYITHIAGQTAEVEERVFGLMVHCLNHKYGCQQIMPLRQITKHLEVCEDTKDANLPRLLDIDPNILAISDRVDHLMLTMSQLQKQTLDHFNRSKEINEKYRQDSEDLRDEIKNKFIGISSDLLHQKTILQKEIDDKHTKTMKEIDGKWSNMEETKNRHAEEMKRVKEQVQRSLTATENTIKQVEDNQRTHANRMKEKMERWKNNILVETTRLQTQTEERCNQKFRDMEEKTTHLRQQLDEMVINRMRDISMEMESLKAFSNQMNELQLHQGEIMNELDRKWKLETDKLNEKWTMVEMMPKAIDEIKHEVGLLDQSQAKIANDLVEKLQQLENSQREEFQIKLDQLAAQIRQSVDEIKMNTAQNMGSTQSEKLPEYNILLVGESGAGKSLMINSIPIYLQHRTLEEALESSEIPCLIPVSFTITNDNFEETKVTYGGNNENESHVDGEYRTVGCASYEFHCNNCVIRLIDSPGVASTQGKEQDQQNMELVMESINTYKEIHAIAIVLKSSQTKLTPQLKSCLDQMLTHLHSSASANLVFLLTHSESTDYKPGSIQPILKKHFEDMKERSVSKVSITLQKCNVFCMDNKGFRYIVAKTQEALSNEEEPGVSYVTSYTKSANEFGRLLKYVIGGRDGPGLSPHQVVNTWTINEARQFIKLVSPTLKKIIKVINKYEDNIKNMVEQKGEFIDTIAKNQDFHTKKEEIDASSFVKKQWLCRSEKCRKYIVEKED